MGIELKCRQCGMAVETDFGYDVNFGAVIKKHGFFKTHRGLVCRSCWEDGRRDRHSAPDRRAPWERS